MTGNNTGGPWGGGGSRGSGKKDKDDKRPPNQTGQTPDIDQLMRKGQEHLKVLMGGKGRGNNTNGTQPPAGMGIGGIGLIIIALFGLWLYSSLYRVDTSEQSVEMFFGQYYKTGSEGLNFAPWPVVTKEVLSVTGERVENIGVGRAARADEGLMLTGDENIVDIDFQVVWNISDAKRFLFNLQSPRETIRAVSESAMREIIARSNLSPILNKDRGAITAELKKLIQKTLDIYGVDDGGNAVGAGVNIIRVNLLGANPPREVIDAFREVQAAEQTRDTLEKQADAYANRVVAEARGEAAQLLEQAEGYRAQIVNQAEGEASRFLAVYEEYVKAPEVTRKRLYLETIEKVYSTSKKVILDENSTGQGVVPYLPLNALNKSNQGDVK